MSMSTCLLLLILVLAVVNYAAVWLEDKFEKKRDIAGDYLRLSSVSQADMNQSSTRCLFTVQFESALSDLSLARAQLATHGYCIIDLRQLGYSSHLHLFDDIKHNASRIESIMNEEDTIPDGKIRLHRVSIIKNDSKVLCCLHRDNVFDDDIYALWIPAKRNKHLMLVPNSSFNSSKQAVDFLRLDDGQVIKELLRKHARISEALALVIFRSCWRRKPFHSSCLHAGILIEDGCGRNSDSLLGFGEEFQSVIVDLKVV